jgi:uncharacterized protein YndB with AHSA1/START domain
VSGERAIELETWFNQPPEVVFEAWTDPRQLAAWFAAGAWEVTRVDFKATVGARWRIDFRHPSGDEYSEEGVLLKVVPGELLEFTLTQVGLRTETFETRVSVCFEAAHGGTRVRFRQVGFPDDTTRDGNQEGWESCFAKLRDSFG